MDFLLPVVRVDLFPSGSEVNVSVYPKNDEIQVNMYSIGDMNPEDFFPNPAIKKK